MTTYFDIRDLDKIRRSRDRLLLEFLTFRILGKPINYVVVDTQFLEGMKKLRDLEVIFTSGTHGQLDRLRDVALVGKDGMGPSARIHEVAGTVHTVDFA